MRWRTKLAFLSVVFQIGLIACDSTSTIVDPNESYFLKFYGGDGDQTGEDMVILPDGSFILFGTTTPSGTGKTSQWYLVKADSKGHVMWEKTFGGPNNEEARDIELTNDNRLVAVGNYYKTSTERDVFIMTLTLDGIKIDSVLLGLKSVATNADTDEDALSVTQTSDGFIVAGSTTNTDLKPNSTANDQRDAMHLRFTNNLKTYANWSQTHGPGTIDVGVKILASGSPLYPFYLFGYTNKFGFSGQVKSDFNFWYFGLNDFGGNSNDFYGGDFIDEQKLGSVAVAPVQSGDGFFLGGITTNSTGASDIYVAKLRKSLVYNATDYQFQKPLSINIGINLPSHTSVFAAQQSGFYILVNENSFNANQNWLLTKINIDGSINWSLPIVYGGDGKDAIGAIQELPDGRIVLLGTMTTGKPDVGELKMTLIKVNQDGKLLN